jgi:hypothetical protein
MKRILLVVLWVLTVASGAYAQRDTTVPGLLIYGKLLAVSPTQITVEEYDNDSAISTRDISIVQQTVIDGCTLDSVQVGVNTLVVLSPVKTYPMQADLVKFDGCTSHIDATATITTISNSVVEVTTTGPSPFGQIGTNIAFLVFAETQYVSCDGLLLSKADLQLGDPVYVRSNGPLDAPRAIAIQTLNDCSQITSAECTFISVADSLIYLQVDNSSDTLSLIISSELMRGVGLPGDSTLPLYRCDGSILALDDLRPGMSMSVSYLISPRRGLFLQYALVKENCPVTVNGAITAINGGIVSVAAYGQAYDVAVSAATDLQNCQRQAITFADLVVGQTVDGYAIDNGGLFEATSLTVLDDCAYAFTTGGIVLTTDSTSTTIEAIDPVTGVTGAVKFNVDNATQYVDCSGLPVNQNAYQTGNTIVLYYRVNKGARTADMLIIHDPCTSNYIGGTVSAIDNQKLTVLIDKGELRSYLLDSSSVLVNCRGDIITLSTATIGQRIEALMTSPNDEGTIVKATIYVDCLESRLVSGTITNANDSLVTVATSQGSRDVIRAPYSIITNDAGMLFDWSELAVGRLVCLVVDESTQMVLRGLVDATCNDHWKPSNNSTMVVGLLKTVEDNQLVVSTAAGEMMFAITPVTQMMDERRNTLGATSMTPGSSVRIMAKNHTAERTPIASTVVLLSTTSVDSDEEAAAEIAVYPNPVSDIVTFSSTEPIESITITITSMIGSRIAELRGIATVDMSAVPSGYYIATVQSGTKRFVTKLIKK